VVKNSAYCTFNHVTFYRVSDHNTRVMHYNCSSSVQQLTFKTVKRKGSINYCIDRYCIIHTKHQYLFPLCFKLFNADSKHCDSCCFKHIILLFIHIILLCNKRLLIAFLVLCYPSCCCLIKQLCFTFKTCLNYTVA